MGAQRPYPVDLIARTSCWQACWIFSSPAERRLLVRNYSSIIHTRPSRAIRPGADANTSLGSLLLFPERQQALRRRTTDHTGDADRNLAKRRRRDAAERDCAA